MFIINSSGDVQWIVASSIRGDQWKKKPFLVMEQVLRDPVASAD